jgi:prophage maintenance system killer protein
MHAFESGNKRTAFLTTKKFVITNGEGFNIPDTEDNVTIMIGIRENYYTQKEIKEWIKYGKIKKFKR